MHSPLKQAQGDRSLERLTILASDADPIPQVLSSLSRGRVNGMSWRRTYGRHDPGKAIYCTLMYESNRGASQAFYIVELSDQPFKNVASFQAIAGDRILGYMRCIPFTHDAKLKTLPDVLALKSPRVLRYRPYKRCTLSVDAPDSGERIFAKVFVDQRGATIHNTALELHKAHEATQLDFNVARPIAWDASRLTLWQHSVPGEPIVEKLFSRQGALLARRMGEACSSINHSFLPSAPTNSAQHQVKRTQRYARELLKRCPILALEIEYFLNAVDKLHARSETTQTYPIHGAPHAHQWLDSGERLGLVDFDRCSQGDRELDVATFMAEMDFEDSKAVPIDELNALFLEGYESASKRVDQNLLRAYRMHKHLAKSLKAARAVRPDAIDRATQYLNRANANLQVWS